MTKDPPHLPPQSMMTSVPGHIQYVLKLWAHDHLSLPSFLMNVPWIASLGWGWLLPMLHFQLLQVLGGSGGGSSAWVKALGSKDSMVHWVAGRTYRLSRPACQRTGEQPAWELREEAGPLTCLGSKLQRHTPLSYLTSFIKYNSRKKYLVMSTWLPQNINP